MIVLPNGYKMKTTLFSDFQIADAFGTDAVQDTFDTAFNEWKGNHIYLTELAIVMSNLSIWHYGKNDDLSRLYTELYNKVDQYCMNNLRGSELAFYLKTTD